MVKNKQSYLDYIPEVMERFRRRADIKEKEIKQKKVPDNFISTYLDAIASSYSTLAVCEFLTNHNALKFKLYFHLAGKIQELSFHKYDDKSMIIDMGLVSWVHYQRFLMALLSDNKELIESLTNLVGGRPEVDKKKGSKLVNNVGYAVKYILLDDYDKAGKHVDVLKSIAGQKNMKLYNGFGGVLDGILKNDEEKVNKELEYMLQCHKKRRDHKDTPEQFLSIPALGLAKLAIIKGIKVTVENDLMPLELLERHDITYPELDFI